ncbi:MAG: TRAP transporter small permease subunit [Alphaproteobacteria bacterium]|nr:TRAP transporter small permease subunit [Alphaproteobacteria bacterium]
MPNAVRTYVRIVEAVNRRVGRLMMFMIFVMMGVMLFSAISKAAAGVSYIWTVEILQFSLAAYYLVGGAYSMQLDSHVRMDLLYGRWSPRGKAIADAITVSMLLFYLVWLLVGGISSTEYALEYGQKNYSSWAPPLAPIKIIMCIGILMMLLQTVAIFFKDLARALGKEL